MSMWPEVLFWYLLVGVILAIGVGVVFKVGNYRTSGVHWFLVWITPVFWFPMAVWGMWMEWRER